MRGGEGASRRPSLAGVRLRVVAVAPLGLGASLRFRAPPPDQADAFEALAPRSSRFLSSCCLLPFLPVALPFGEAWLAADAPGAPGETAPDEGGTEAGEAVRAGDGDGDGEGGRAVSPGTKGVRFLSR